MEYQNVKFQENSLFLVTGRAVFIGSNLCKAVLNLGYITVLMTLSTGEQINVDLFSRGNAVCFDSITERHRGLYVVELQK